MHRFLTTGVLLTTYALTTQESFGSLLPGQTEVLYFSSYSYTATVNSPGSIIQDAPPLPNLATFDDKALLADFGGSVDTTLYTWGGVFEVDLGTTVLNASDPADGVVLGYIPYTVLTTDQQQALFNQTCPYFETYGYPASECTGWFQADVTNTGTVPIDFLQETFVGLGGAIYDGTTLDGIFQVAAEALPSDLAQRFPDSSPAPEPGSLAELIAAGIVLIALASNQGFRYLR